MHQNNSHNICLLIPLVKHNFCSIVFGVQNWQIWENEVLDEKVEYILIKHECYRYDNMTDIANWEDSFVSNWL